MFDTRRDIDFGAAERGDNCVCCERWARCYNDNPVRSTLDFFLWLTIHHIRLPVYIFHVNNNRIAEQGLIVINLALGIEFQLRRKQSRVFFRLERQFQKRSTFNRRNRRNCRRRSCASCLGSFRGSLVR